MSWIAQVNDDGTVDLPEDVMARLNWKPGDVLHWRSIEKGSASVSRCTEITPMDLHLYLDNYLEDAAAGQAFVVADETCKYLLAEVGVALSSLSQVTSEPT
jgi:hypothetical protein